MSSGLVLAVLASVGMLSAQPLVEGRADSPVQVVIYEDLQCPDCAAFRRMLDEKLLPRYGSRVAFVHRDFPLAKHAWARRAAIAGRFFAETKPGAAIEYRRHVLSSIKEITDSNLEEKLSAFAREHGADAGQVLAALEGSRYAALVDKDFQEGVARGVSKTPTVLVNGTPFIETFTFEQISKAIDEALAEGGSPLPDGRGSVRRVSPPPSRERE